MDNNYLLEKEDSFVDLNTGVKYTKNSQGDIVEVPKYPFKRFKNEVNEDPKLLELSVKDLAMIFEIDKSEAKRLRKKYYKKLYNVNDALAQAQKDYEEYTTLEKERTVTLRFTCTNLEFDNILKIINENN